MIVDLGLRAEFECDCVKWGRYEQCPSFQFHSSDLAGSHPHYHPTPSHLPIHTLTTLFTLSHLPTVTLTTIPYPPISLFTPSLPSHTLPSPYSHPHYHPTPSHLPIHTLTTIPHPPISLFTPSLPSHTLPSPYSHLPTLFTLSLLNLLHHHTLTGVGGTGKSVHYRAW